MSWFVFFATLVVPIWGKADLILRTFPSAYCKTYSLLKRTIGLLVHVNICPIQISKSGEPVAWIKEDCIGEMNDEMQCSVQYIVPCAMQTRA